MKFPFPVITSYIELGVLWVSLNGNSYNRFPLEALKLVRFITRKLAIMNQITEELYSNLTLIQLAVRLELCNQTVFSPLCSQLLKTLNTKHVFIDVSSVGSQFPQDFGNTETVVLNFDKEVCLDTVFQVKARYQTIIQNLRMTVEQFLEQLELWKNGRLFPTKRINLTAMKYCPIDYLIRAMNEIYQEKGISQRRTSNGMISCWKLTQTTNPQKHLRIHLCWEKQHHYYYIALKQYTK